MAKRGRRRSTKSKTRRRRFSGVRRKARRAARRTKRFFKKRGTSIVTTITNFIPPVASVQLLSHNQVSALPQNAPMSMKLKAMANGVIGSIFDFNIFADAPQAHVHFDIEGAFNQWTAIAAGGIVAGFIGKKLKIRRSGMLSSMGNKLILPAAISGALGFKNNNPPAGQRHSPYMQNRSQSQQSSFVSVPQITSNGGGVA